MSNNEELPQIYQNLISRVKEIEDRLTKINTSTTSQIDHEKDDSLELVDDELDTDRIDPVLLSSKAYLKMAIHAKKYANSKVPKDRWVEVIGLLTGHIVNEDTPIEQIKIVDAWPIGHGDAVSVEIMESRSFTEVINQLPKGDFIVGWYHSHPSYGNFLSTDDYDTQNRYQSLWSKAVALVIDPTQFSKSNFGFGVFRNTRKEPGSKGYTELSCEVDGLSERSANDILKMIRPAYEGSDLKFLEYE